MTDGVYTTRTSAHPHVRPNPAHAAFLSELFHYGQVSSDATKAAAATSKTRKPDAPVSTTSKRTRKSIPIEVMMGTAHLSS